jgi:hypothetical protein
MTHPINNISRVKGDRMSPEISIPSAQEATRGPAAPEPWAAARVQAGVAASQSGPATRKAGDEAMVVFLAMARAQEVILTADPTSALPGTKVFVALTVRLKEHVTEHLLEQARRNDLGLGMAFKPHETEEDDAECLSYALQPPPPQFSLVTRRSSTSTHAAPAPRRPGPTGSTRTGPCAGSTPGTPRPVDESQPPEPPRYEVPQ